MEIELVDENFQPLAGEPYEIVLPDGKRKRGTLDAAGKARFVDIDPGTCEVSFPNIDGGEYRKIN